MKAILISIDTDCSEFLNLADTANIEIVNTYVQKRRYSDPVSFIGKGKLEEIVECVKDDRPDLILVNGILKPIQHYNIEQSMKIECLDRTGLILKIFKLRAKTPEVKLQIESARLKYELPLLKEWIHRSKTGEHPGFMAGGEYGINVYYDLIKRQSIKLSQELKKIEKDRNIKRNKRKKLGCKIVSLVGYTNAGKSTLFNLLTSNNVFVDDKLFSTLETTTRKIITSNKMPIILTDTIGFIGNMPSWLLESFQATLEEIHESDCILWILDGADDEDVIRKKYMVCKNIVNTEMGKIVPIVTKIDLISKETKAKRSEFIKELFEQYPIMSSARTNEGIDEIIKTVMGLLIIPLCVVIELNSDSKSHNIISQLYSRITINNIIYGDKIRLFARCNNEDIKTIKSICKGIKYEIEIER